ncbi:MAG: cytochrome c biogenesis protein DipZ [Candidatus Doudnabacteria bacterium]|nr:cytochrome c biogenesis protein DipZ [Candidatus Doudnabacteria bacterium]
MIIQILFAVLAGILTIAAPCILPMLPILLGASVGQQSKQRPLFIVLGFIVSFSAAALVLSAIISHFGLSPNLLRDIAVVCLAIFGLLMIWPKPFELLAMNMSGTINSANKLGGGSGNTGGLLLGLVLGIVWTPCAGPILGSILTLVAVSGSTSKSVILMIAYALGAGIPMLIIAYGSQWITTKVKWLAQYSVRLQQIFGILILLLAAAMYFQYDVVIEAALTQAFPQSGLETQLVQNGNPILNTNHNAPMESAALPSPPATGQSTTTTSQNSVRPATPLDVVPLQNFGKAPDFTGIDHWLDLPNNAQSLSLADLKGKVVLVDFWTLSCINCIRTLPYVTKWYDTYKGRGLVVVGIHTPEFDFEKDTGNVQNAIERFNIHYPVAQDNEYTTWNAYNNEYWPAEYLIDQKGNIVHEHFGEGEYDVMENAIRELLNENTAVGPENGSNLQGVGSPEMYFEISRLKNLTPDQQASSQPQTYALTQNLALNNFALEGTWQFTGDHATLVGGPGKIRLHYHASNVYMVASSDKPVTVTVFVDGKQASQVTIQSSRLYQLVQSDYANDYTVEIDIPQAGLNAFTFTFG